MTTPPTPEQLATLACSGCVADVVVSRGALDGWIVDVRHDPACLKLAKRARRARNTRGKRRARSTIPVHHDFSMSTRSTAYATGYGTVRHSARGSVGGGRD